jgi:hypothetical protein
MILHNFALTEEVADADFLRKMFSRISVSNHVTSCDQVCNHVVIFDPRGFCIVRK